MHSFDFHQEPPMPFRQRGFTLIELLVVLAILGVLLGLLLPAVQKARASLQVTQCGNNLHQLGVAMQTYHDAEGFYPPAYVTDTRASGTAHGVSYPDDNGNGPSGFAW